ncbi:MAG: hypothetical protein QJR05_06865 [Thermoanaerobacterium sp.]|nr:hypothetical protein [Thermoanaerobacterium sp.]
MTINDVQYFFAVEVDGKHHENTVQKDLEKNQYAANNKIHLQRVRDLELADIELEHLNNIIQRTSTDKKELNKIIPELLNRFIKWLSNLNMENENSTS